MALAVPPPVSRCCWCGESSLLHPELVAHGDSAYPVYACLCPSSPSAPAQGFPTWVFDSSSAGRSPARAASHHGFSKRTISPGPWAVTATAATAATAATTRTRCAPRSAPAPTEKGVRLARMRRPGPEPVRLSSARVPRRWNASCHQPPSPGLVFEGSHLVRHMQPMGTPAIR